MFREWQANNFCACEWVVFIPLVWLALTSSVYLLCCRACKNRCPGLRGSLPATRATHTIKFHNILESLRSLIYIEGTRLRRLFQSSCWFHWYVCDMGWFQKHVGRSGGGGLISMCHGSSVPNRDTSLLSMYANKWNDHFDIVQCPLVPYTLNWTVHEINNKSTGFPQNIQCQKANMVERGFQRRPHPSHFVFCCEKISFLHNVDTSIFAGTKLGLL